MTYTDTATMNGKTVLEELAEAEELAQRDEQREAAREPQQLTVLEKINGELSAFEQQHHKEMLEAVARMATHWVAELQHLRDNTHAVERMVLQACAKAEGDITRMHLAGAMVMKEAERGQQICQQIYEVIDTILDPRT